MNLEVIRRTSADQSEFVTRWNALYSYPNSALYTDNIGLPLTQDRVWNLYKWKNGTLEISSKKKQSIERTYLKALEQLPTLKTVEEGKAYINNLDGGGIWDIFWLHCLNHEIFSIFDQHTYRAMARINGLVPAEIPNTRTAKLNIYFEQYLKFLSKFGGTPHRQVDQALFTYGRFLKSEFAAQ